VKETENKIPIKQPSIEVTKPMWRLATRKKEFGAKK